MFNDNENKSKTPTSSAIDRMELTIKNERVK